MFFSWKQWYIFVVSGVIIDLSIYMKMKIDGIVFVTIQIFIFSVRQNWNWQTDVMIKN
jgi:hypothetical protein